MGESKKLLAASEREHESQIRAQVEEENHGKIVAIDLETGAFEVDASELAACDRELKCLILKYLIKMTIGRSKSFQMLKATIEKVIIQLTVIMNFRMGQRDRPRPNVRHLSKCS